MAAAVLAAGLALVVVAIVQHHNSDAARSAQAARRAAVERRAAAEARGRSSPAPTSPSSGAAPAVSSVDASGATLVVPALSVRAPIVAVGGVDGSMSIPSDIHTVGWYDGIDATGTGSSGTGSSGTAPSAPFPGQPGVAVLAGHVDWAGQGPGALYYLSQLQVGDPIEVVGSNGVTTDWQVSQPPVTLAKSALPAALFSNTGPPQLALVTCGGPFDAATGHYQDNVIVWASPSAAT